MATVIKTLKRGSDIILPRTRTEAVTMSDGTTSVEQALNSKADATHEAWITPTLLNGWVQGYSVRYRKNSIGQLEIKGRVRGGTIGLAVFKLPLGYRPDNHRTFATMSNWGLAGGYVASDGDFIINSAYQKDTWVAIDVIIII